MNRSVWTLVGVVIFLGAGLPAQDVVHLSNGATLEGAVVHENETLITLRLGDGTIDLAKSLVKQIVRGAPDLEEETARALLTLSRFEDRESWHFLYRKGERVGYRHISLARDVHEGIPGYRLEDRLVFLTEPGLGPEAELTVKEFVDAELRPLHVLCRRRSGISGWELEGAREENALNIAERWAGQVRRRKALLRPDVVLWGMHLRRMATDAPPEGGYRPLTLFDPPAASFKRVEVTRRIDRITFNGRPTDVLVFRRRVGGDSLETWVDMAGRVLREEITSPFLVSRLVTAEAVRAYRAGEDTPDKKSIGLEFTSVESGFRVLRPDAAWEMDVPEASERRLVSFLRPGLRATVDVFRLHGFAGGTTGEGIALDVFGRMQDRCENFSADGPFQGDVGDRRGLRFKLESRRRDQELTTLGAILMDEDQAFVILCAAPTTHYKDAAPAFKEVLDSIRISRMTAEPAQRLDPFDGMPVEEEVRREDG